MIDAGRCVDVGGHPASSLAPVIPSHARGRFWLVSVGVFSSDSSSEKKPRAGSKLLGLNPAGSILEEDAVVLGGEEKTDRA